MTLDQAAGVRVPAPRLAHPGHGTEAAMVTDAHGQGHILQYLEQRQLGGGGLDLVFTVVPQIGDPRFWQCIESELERRGLSNAECFGDGSIHRITLTVQPSNFDASTDQLEAAVTDASKDYLERVLPAHEAAVAEAAATEARQKREAELIDEKLRIRFPGLQ
jgi:hypothetical protein